MKADSTPIIEDNYFYLMKGFFISKKGNTSGPNLAEASPSDPLTLTARVYNYSLMSTDVTTDCARFTCASTVSSIARVPALRGRAARTAALPARTPGLCGNSFQIGSDQIIPSIAGFKAEGTEPNWTTANVDFLPANFDATRAATPTWSSG